MPAEPIDAPARAADGRLRWPAGIALAALVLLPLLHWDSEFQATKLAGLVVLAALALLARLRRLGREPVLSFPAPRFFLAAGALLAWETLSLAWSPVPMRGLEVVLRVASQIALAWVLLEGDVRLRRLALAAAVPAAWVSLYGFLQWKGVLEIPYDNYGLPNPSATMGLTNYASEFLVAVLPWMAVAFLTEGGLTRVALAAAAAFSLVYLLIAENRASWLGFLAAGGVMILGALVRGRRRPRPLRALAAVLVLCVGALVFYQTTDTGAEIAARFGSIFHRTDTDITFRLLTWKATLRIWKDHPIAGVGAEGLETTYPRYLSLPLAQMVSATHTYVNRAHNEYLEAMATYGTVGLLLMLWPIAEACLGLGRVLRRRGPPEEDAEALAWAGSIVALLVTAFFSFNLQGYVTGWMSWIALGAAARLRAPVRRVEVPREAPWRTPVLAVGLVLLMAGVLQSVRYAMGEIHHRRGSVDLKVRMWDFAVDQYARAIWWYPYPEDYHFNLAVALANESRPDEAMQSLRDVLRIDPNHAVAHEFLGTLLSKAGQMGEAARQFEEAAAISPLKRGALLKQAGEIFLVSGNYQDAYAACRDEAARQDPDAMYCAAEALRPLGRSYEARDLLQALLKKVPQYPGGHRLLGLALRETGDPLGAIRELRAAAAQDPHDGVAWYALGTSVLGRGDRKEALADLERAIQEDSSLRAHAATDLDYSALKRNPAFRRLVLPPKAGR